MPIIDGIMDTCTDSASYAQHCQFQVKLLSIAVKLLYLPSAAYWVWVLFGSGPAESVSDQMSLSRYSASYRAHYKLTTHRYLSIRPHENWFL